MAAAAAMISAGTDRVVVAAGYLVTFTELIGGLLLMAGLLTRLAAIALRFGPWEFFSLFVLAMAMVAGAARSMGLEVKG